MGAAMGAWEHRQEVATAGSSEQILKSCGADGWELVTALIVPVASSPLMTQAAPGLLLLFKRPTQLCPTSVDQ